MYLKYIVGVIFMLMSNCECDSNKELHKRVKKFIVIVNKIPTLRKNPEIFSDNEINNLLHRMDHQSSFYFFKPEKIQNKSAELRCAYSLVCLHLLYHLRCMVLLNQINEPTIQLYLECVHRMLSVLTFVQIRVPVGIWFVSISLDAVNSNQLNIHELDYDKLSNLNYDYCSLCEKRNNLHDIFVPEQYNEENMKYSVRYIESEINFLKLTKDSEDLNELFIFENSFNIYELIWNGNHDYRVIIPKRTLFPFYNDKIVEQSYITAKNSWIKDYFIILTYIDTIAQNILLVLYYSIVCHLYYIKRMWFIIFERKTWFNLESENYRILKESSKDFLEMPLNTLNEMTCYADQENLNFIKYVITFLSSHEDVSKKDLDKVLSLTLRYYNKYAKMYGSEKELVVDLTKKENTQPLRVAMSSHKDVSKRRHDDNKLNSTLSQSDKYTKTNRSENELLVNSTEKKKLQSLKEVVDIPKTCNLKEIKEGLQKICYDMDEYFKGLKETTSPLYWSTVKKFFTSKQAFKM